MRINLPEFDQVVSPLLSRFRKDNFTHQEIDLNPPLRSELFSKEQMEQHAQRLAHLHVVTNTDTPELLLGELSTNEEILFEVNERLKESVSEKKSISPAAEWLLDNFYLTEEQIRIAKRYLPKGYSKGLPKLKNGFPRVYEIAIEIISHSDGRIDIASLSNFIVAYQKESELTLGELWAIPIMLRLALLENLSRVATRIAVAKEDSALANDWAKRIIATVEKRPQDLVLIIADMARSNPPMVSSFVAEFARKLQWRGPELNLPLIWVEQHLSGTESTINSMVLIENQKQAADQVSVSNSIGSLRLLAKMDWRDFVEAMSLVEQTLRKGDGVYAAMDFYTRDEYRHRVEAIAKVSPLSEREVAQIAIDLAQASTLHEPSDERKGHVGYYLINKGVVDTERKAGVRLSTLQSIHKHMDRAGTINYWVVSGGITLLVAGSMLQKLMGDNLHPGWIVATGILCLIVASQVALGVTNWWATVWIKPKPLPKMNFSLEIPAACRTIVVIPTMLVSLPQLERLIEDLEVRYLANRDSNLLFALLTDFEDSAFETLEEDRDLIDLARKKTEELNRKYERLTNDTFFLFHRARAWNSSEGLWMGYERKRGKLLALNHLLRGMHKDQFSVTVGDEQVYTTAKYVITLDTDTQLPRDSAWKLVGLMAHPLNGPVYDDKKKRVVEGYAIIQPRIAISLHRATRSGYSRLHENDAGIDPYTRVTSDVYQDVFGEGSFVGKGIYEIDAFEKTLGNRFPDNRILSHDLLEGSYARCGFASDVQLYENYPSSYAVDISRRYRWIRGDWQIARWCLPFVPDATRASKKNSLSGLSRWKIFDNLRRSIVPIACTLLLVAGWTVLSSAWFWTLSVLVIAFLPSSISSIWNAIVKPKEVALGQHISNAANLSSKSALQAAFTMMVLPYEAFVSVDAICRTAWRLLVSGKSLLEWNPSGSMRKQGDDLRTAYRTMWVSPTMALIVLMYLLMENPATLLFAAPFLLLWAISPAVVHELGRPSARPTSLLREDQKIYLRELARKTWSFFEKLVSPEDNWLPPDNLQEYPTQVIAHRTSPTNIGLSLLANLSALDFGYTTTKQLLEQTTNTFASMGKLEKYKGHFYNWYDTRTLTPLNPKYISTVDSGNLAGHLLTLRQGLLRISQQCIFERKIFLGLQDTLRLAMNGVSSSDKEMHVALQYFYDSIELKNFDLPSLQEHVDRLLENYRRITSSESHERARTEPDWLDIFEKHLEAIREELLLLAPWLQKRPLLPRFVDWKIVSAIPTLNELAEMPHRIKEEVEQQRLLDNSEEERHWLEHFEQCASQASQLAQKRLDAIQTLALQCYEFSDMEYQFLYDKPQHLLSIGYDVDEQRRDSSYYDLLASEARLGLFVAIAQGKLPQESWFALGRRLTTVGTTPVLLSWSGSMFEYLMPGLVMPTYDNTLLDEMCIGAVRKQIEYGRLQNMEWGISESCYNLVDAHLTYQYKAFGIPGLGFKRGLGQDLVVAPYATLLALMVDPQEACSNLERMKAKGFEGTYGFYEAIDYSPLRLSRGQTHALLKTFMTHHQGMSLLSISYVVHDRPMQKRFEADTQFQSALLLLQERVPKSTGFYSGSSDVENTTTTSTTTEIRIIQTPATAVPEVQLLSNGRLFVMISNAGGGYCRWKDMAVTRWREDSTCDNWGMFCYIHDRDKKSFWSIAHQPTLIAADQYEAIFSQGRVEFRRRDDGVETHTVVIVSPEDDVEVRRIHLTNRSSGKKRLEVTSYGEVVLAAAAADDAHPAFSNLFVQTEINEHQNAIVCTRRPRSTEEHPPWMFHVMKASGVKATEISYETDRCKFIGRGHTLHHPQVMDQTDPLSNSQGSVLDPIVSIQYKLNLQAGESVTLDIVTGIAETREANQNLIDKYQDKHLRDRAFELSYTHSQVVLRQIGASAADAQLYGKLASSILYLNSSLRAHSNVILKNRRGQSALWSYSISGDFPIVLLFVSGADNVSIVRQVIKAQAYWYMNGLTVDLVILNEDTSGYRQSLQEQILGIIAAGAGIVTTEKKGHIFVRPIDQISDEDRTLLQTVARVILSDAKGLLEDQLSKSNPPPVHIPKLIPSRSYSSIQPKTVLPADLQYFNGTGGFSADGKEYVIHTGAKRHTPLPWINVIANPHFGTLVSERGSSYTWFENARAFRLTPWKNDTVLDSSGEAFYLRDEESGQYWSPLGLPAPGQAPYVTRHGFGYSKFEHDEDGIRSEVSVHVDSEFPIKFVIVRVVNQSGRTRKLSATGYMEWILGELRSSSVMHVITEWNVAAGAVIAKNQFNTDFQEYVSFFSVDEPDVSYTADRKEFIGRNGSLQNPEGMSRAYLSGRTGAGLDACAAIQVPFELQNGAERTVIFKVGAGANIKKVLATIQKFQGIHDAADSLKRVKDFWQDTLGVIQVKTPDLSINILANGWLLYQVLSCRVWGRSGLYQSGGAYGFRDQLQDVIALMHAQPHLARKQILLCSSRQFEEGDVQHWWHPPNGRGVRTLCSDDMLWLPYVTSLYVSVTGDSEVLDESAPFLQGRPLGVNEESYYDLPQPSGKRATVYDHSKLSIRHSFQFGVHGLPLIGSGDWNDGMNRVGIKGKGESVWLAFFLYDVLVRFMTVATLRGDLAFVEEMATYASQLKKSIHQYAWDGKWYLRAYFDDGSPLGSSSSDECTIDSLSQSWSVLSGAGESERLLSGMQAVDTHLIDRVNRLIKVLDPPFNKTNMDPGYIKGYLPGVRENGGQYTHAAIWTAMAYAKLGDQKKTEELLNLINPIHHGSSPDEVTCYKVEPYVMAADVYGVSPHAGRGGWTWYTGSAGWMYQLILESCLGLRREGNTLKFEPCIPVSWKSFTIHYRFQETPYTIEVIQNPEEEAGVYLDSVRQDNSALQLVNDGHEHAVLFIVEKRGVMEASTVPSLPS